LDACILARLEQTWAHRAEKERSQAWIERQMGKVSSSLAAMERGLGDKAFCTGIHLSLADIAVGCTLGYLDFRFSTFNWRDGHPELNRLYEKLKVRPSFIETEPTL
jgi:glutathione S-transferase